MEGFNLRKLNNVEFKEQYQFKISNRFATFENVEVDDDDDDDDDDVDSNGTKESIRENMKASAAESLGVTLR
jgi:hypothetical protein